MLVFYKISEYEYGGESLPLAPKQVAPRIVPASSAASLRFVACPLPLLAGTPRNAPCQHSDKKEESRQNTSFLLFQFAHKTKFYCPLEFPSYYDSAVSVVSMIQFLFACNINIHSFAICFKTWNYALIVMLPTVDFHKIHQCAVCTWNC